ncbi:major facilitator superfamily transporter [Armillaria mellea]|nr:major facilitator superfamily transporter [Armillaria mellea]
MVSETPEKTLFNEKNVVIEAVTYEAKDDSKVTIASEYTPEQYKKLHRKMDCYLLPLIIQQANKTGLSTMVTFGLHEDTGLVGQQYSWLTTGFYLTYMFICWGVIILCIGFSKNFKHLIALHALQGFFECCSSANARFSVIANLTLYGIGMLEYNGKDIQAWRYISLTIAVRLLCLYFLGTPSKVPWLTKEEKQMANTRILENQSGHDQTGTKMWKWDQARQCLVDPCFYFAGINTFLSSVPNGGLMTFRSIINTSFGFTSLQVILYTIPRSMTSIMIFIIIGLVMSKWKNLHLYIMAFAMIPLFIRFLGMALIEMSPSTKMYYMTQTVASSFTFIGYCVGNMCGSQIFKTKDAPTYMPGVIGCSICFGLEFLIIIGACNRHQDKAMLTDGLTQEEREMQGKINGESDMMDFENPHFRYTL